MTKILVFGFVLMCY